MPIITRKEALHVHNVNLAVWSGVDQLSQSSVLEKKASFTRWNAATGQRVFIDDICSRLKGHRRYKYIWKSLFTVEGAFPPCLRMSRVCVPSNRIPAPALHSDSPPHVK